MAYDRPGGEGTGKGRRTCCSAERLSACKLPGVHMQLPTGWTSKPLAACRHLSCAESCRMTQHTCLTFACNMCASGSPCFRQSSCLVSSLIAYMQRMHKVLSCANTMQQKRRGETPLACLGMHRLSILVLTSMHTACSPCVPHCKHLKTAWL